MCLVEFLTHLVDEQDSRNDLCLALLSPVADFCVDLVSQLRLDLSSVTCDRSTSVLHQLRIREGHTSEEGEESLSSRVDNIDLVEGYGVDGLLAHLQLTLGALYELGLRAEAVSNHQRLR